MSKALVTFGVGAAQELLEIAEPGFREYANRHDYQLLIADEIPVTRPASWFKVCALLQALRDFDEVLWLDADVVIVDGSTDIADEIPDDKWQGLAVHNSSASDGTHPNHGVWFARQPMVPVLERIWSMTQYLHHVWWEQAASLEMLGFDPQCRPVVLRSRTELLERTALLGSEWNALPEAGVDHPRFRHAAARPDRRALMQEWAEAACVS